MREPGAAQIGGMKHEQLGLVLVVVVADKQPPTAVVLADSGVRPGEIFQEYGVRDPTVGEAVGPKQLHASLGQGLRNAVNGSSVLNELGIGSVRGECKYIPRGGYCAVRPGFERYDPAASLLPR